MTKERRTAPNPEWVQMYRQGIPSPKIAAIAGAAESTIRYHLRLATKAEPGLRAKHKAAVVAVTRHTSAGLQKVNDIVAFHQTEGRLPAAGGRTAWERALGVWLHRRRQDAMVGSLPPPTSKAFRSGRRIVVIRPSLSANPRRTNCGLKWWSFAVSPCS